MDKVLINTIPEFCRSKRETVFGVATKAAIPPSTMYRLRKTYRQIPDGKVISAIFTAYPGTTANDLIREVTPKELADILQEREIQDAIDKLNRNKRNK